MIGPSPSPPIPLAHGGAIPVLGLGTFKLTDTSCEQAVCHALESGYRHIDTADFYGNQRSVGRALRSSGIPREQIFLTTKVWRDQLAFGDVQRACQKALDELQTSYLDLYLVHWPNDGIPIVKTMEAMADLRRQDLIAAAGVSNFTISRLREALQVAPGSIAVNQVEYHPFLNQESLRVYCASQGIVLTAYCPLARGAVTTDPLLVEIAQRIGRTPAQVALRWMIDKGIVVIPKSASHERISENYGVLDWRLSQADQAAINGRRSRHRLVDWDVAGFDD